MLLIIVTSTCIGEVDNLEANFHYLYQINKLITTLPGGPNCLLAAAYLIAIVKAMQPISPVSLDTTTLPPDRLAIELANLFPSFSISDSYVPTPKYE